MRIPNLSDLDREQERIYLEAPQDGAILVTGPPGSGKTIMAWHRAQYLLDQGISVQLTMYTKVLRRYVECGGDGGGPEVQHLDRWVMHWWRHAGFGYLPKRRTGGHGYQPIDWEKMLEIALQHAGTTRLAQLNWGHLLIDEGQDFSAEMYRTLVIMRKFLAHKGVAPGLTVFADDNQKIHDADESTTKEIAEILVPGELGKRQADRERLFRLKKNYRNTRQIHELSWYFAVFEEEDGVIPEPPSRDGNLPECRLFTNDNEIVNFIKRICVARPAQEVGVVIPSYRGRRRVKQIYNKLSYHLKQTPYSVQAYINQHAKSQAFDPAFCESNLAFNEPNIVTIVTDKSVKGLEFDIVFLLDLESLAVADDGAEESAKNLFVCCSRARNELFFCCVADGSTPPSILGFLPPKSDRLCKYTPPDRYTELEPRLQRVEVPKRWIRGRQ